MEATTLPAQRRTHLGSKHTRRVRQKGQIPAIIYGHNEEPIPVALDAHELGNVLLHHSRVVSIDLDNQPAQYLIKAVQYDHLQTTPIHLDLMRVDMDEKVELEVEIVLRGMPKGAHDGGVLHQPVTRVRVACVVTAIPEEIKHSVVELGLGDMLRMRDLHVPEGVTILNEPDEVIAVCREPVTAVEVEAVEGEEPTTAEPEVIGKKPEEQEESS
jgi:large subunit ribosomal protein L25